MYLLLNIFLWLNELNKSALSLNKKLRFFNINRCNLSRKKAISKMFRVNIPSSTSSSSSTSSWTNDANALAFICGDIGDVGRKKMEKNCNFIITFHKRRRISARSWFSTKKLDRLSITKIKRGNLREQCKNEKRHLYLRSCPYVFVFDTLTHTIPIVKHSINKALILPLHNLWPDHLPP